MKHFKKFLSSLLIISVLIGSSAILPSCAPSYSNYKKIAYKKRGARKSGYHSHYAGRLKRNTVSLHQNYIIKNNRRTTYHY